MESGFSVESLENGILACKKNIKTFEDAIDRERETIKEYHVMIETIEEKARIEKQKEKMKSQIKIERD